VPIYIRRALAILLLIVVTPFLLFAGYCGLTAGATLLGPIVLVVFGVGAFITYKGIQALWRKHDAAATMLWVVALVVFAFLWCASTCGQTNLSAGTIENCPSEQRSRSSRSPSYQYKRRAKRSV
jgi:hypothetical protein